MLHKLDLKGLFKQKVQELTNGKSLSPRLHPSRPLCYIALRHCGCCRRQCSKAVQETRGLSRWQGPGLPPAQDLGQGSLVAPQLQGT